MTDPGFVTSAYAIVLGGLALYVWSIVRRSRAARRLAAAIERERTQDSRGPAAAAITPPVQPTGTQ